MKPNLLTIVGPTGVGKTKKAIEIAKILDCQIISCDSRQLYREMNIGTAKPSEDELAEVKHFFINSLSIQDEYSSGTFEREVLTLLETLFSSQNTVLMVGGSGLFTHAVWHGFDDIPQTNGKEREILNQIFKEKGLPPLLEELEKKDKAYWDKVDKNNPQRIIRALEIIRTSGQPYSMMRTHKKKNRFFQNLKVGLDLPREQLYERINERVDKMMDRGWVEEAKKLYKFRHLNALQTLGYQEVFSYLEGKYDKEEMLEIIKRNSRRYAKKQLTWFKAQEDIVWFDAGVSATHILQYFHLK